MKKLRKLFFKNGELDVEKIKEAGLEDIYVKAIKDKISQKRIEFIFHSKQESLHYIPQVTAAGNSYILPSKIEISDKIPLEDSNVCLCFYKNPHDNNLEISIDAPSTKIKTKINLKVSYKNSSDIDEFFGRDLLHQGVWTLSDEKHKNVKNIEVFFLD